MRALKHLIAPRAAAARFRAACARAALTAGGTRRFTYPAVPGSAAAAEADVARALAGCPLAAAAATCARMLAANTARRCRRHRGRGDQRSAT